MNYSLCWVQYNLTCQQPAIGGRKLTGPPPSPLSYSLLMDSSGEDFSLMHPTRFCCLVSYTVSNTALVKLSGSESKMKRQKHGRWICRGWQGWEGVKRCWRERISNMHLYTYNITGQISFIKTNEYKI